MGMMIHHPAVRDLMAAPFKFGTLNLSPGANGNALIPHGLGTTPVWADAKIKGDMGGVDINVQIQALDATNITLRFSTAVGVDITTGGPYAVIWQAR